MAQQRTSMFVLVGSIAVAVVMLVSLLAGSGVQPLKDFNPVNLISSFFQPRAAAGGIQVELRAGEGSAQISIESANAELAQHGVITKSLKAMVPDLSACTMIRGSQVGALILCAPVSAPALGTASVDGSFNTLISRLTAQADELMRDPTVGAVTVAKFDTALTEHRQLLIQQGSAVLDFVTEYDLSGVVYAGLTLDRAGGSEWLGLTDAGGVTHLAWAWAPNSEALSDLLSR
jgi:hypothetical protein